MFSVDLCQAVAASPPPPGPCYPICTSSFWGHLVPPLSTLKPHPLNTGCVQKTPVLRFLEKVFIEKSWLQNRFKLRSSPELEWQ